jgi:hypothetical protein
MRTTVKGYFGAAAWVACLFVCDRARASYFEACELHGVIETAPEATQIRMGVAFQFRVTEVAPFHYPREDSPLSEVECSSWRGTTQKIAINLKRPYKPGSLSVGQSLLLRTVAFDASDQTGQSGTYRWIELVTPAAAEVSMAGASPDTSLERTRGR